ncbi:hypothetical protein D3C77_598750 [compost metagenome]
MPMIDYLTGSHYYGIVPYKVKQNYSKSNEHKELFYRFFGGIGYIEAHGDRIEYNGITGFIFSSNETGTVAIEGRSGCVIARGKNEHEIKDAFKNIIDSKGVDTINTLVNNLIEKNDISPLYKPREAFLI